MSRIALAIVIGLFCCGPVVKTAGQSRKIDSPEVLKQLIAMPAPTPRIGQTQTPPPDSAEPRPADFYDQEKTPPDDAPIADLVDYW